MLLQGFLKRGSFTNPPRIVSLRPSMGNITDYVMVADQNEDLWCLEGYQELKALLNVWKAKGELSYLSVSSS